MRRRPIFWLLIGVLCLAAVFWAGERRKQRGEGRNARETTGQQDNRTTGQRKTQNTARNAQQAKTETNRFAYRLSNTTKSLSELSRSDHAILLENALFDTERRTAGGAPATPAIPEKLRSHGDPGAYIVQARGPLDDTFRALLKNAGATIVSFIPNNAYLIRASQTAAQAIQANPQTEAVLPYEPYYKLKSSLLKLAVEDEPLPANSTLNVLLFSDAKGSTLADLRKAGITILGEERSPFGTVVRIQPTVNSLSSVASLSGVQEIELAYNRVPANDLSRVRVAVATNTLTQTNYLGLSGAGVTVSVNDSGIEVVHPDLAGRVIGDSPLSIIDPDGHGTHVAGIIAGSGLESTTVTGYVPGSITPATNGQFRGKAPSATLLSSRVDLNFGPYSSDAYLQQLSAQTNVLISNNSWNYFADDQYDLPAASYDAAVRDALPLVSGSQPVLFVFAAGNSGRGDDSGIGGIPGTIQSPATAKNVITVGYIEQPRFITNQVILSGSTNPTSVWLGMTDSTDQVGADSSRGNVGIGIEGQFGRFKPDVVAPGTFVVSTRSSTWTGGATNHSYQYFRNMVLAPGDSFLTPVFLPANTVQWVLRFITNASSQPALNTLPIYAKQSAPPTQAVFDYSGPSPLVIANPAPVGTTWRYGVFNNTTSNLVFDILSDAVLTNDPTVAQALVQLNTNLAPYYRYESGSSMAAADASGVLALMQEFFQGRQALTNSPALMKALLINGARGLGRPYDFEVTNTINFQGWGLINLTNTIPGGLAAHSAPSNSLFFVDQSPTNSLATGQSHTYRVDISDDAALEPLRITLVWTDPAGNPLAGKKLVNDLDLIVTNLDDPNQVFVGNYILSGSEVNSPWDTNIVATLDDLRDTVNNVENVYIGGTILPTAFSITVVGHRVNVNAVTAHTNDIVQDYALVVSCGDGDVTNAMAFSRVSTDFVTVPFVTGVSNQFANSGTDTGGLLIGQRTGASSPLLGTNQIPLLTNGFGIITLGETNQWHFFTITNSNGYTNAAFLTFDSVNLAVPRMGVYQPFTDNATRPDADVDLYVSTDPDITNLSPVALGAAYKSTGRGGTETIILSNALPGIYYAGVKAEDQMAAEFSFLGDFSSLPFGSTDAQGNQTLRGIGLPQDIPDGTPSNPGGIRVLAVGRQMLARRVVVTNTITHELVGDLVASIRNESTNATLINHSPEATVVQKQYVFDDSNEGDIFGAQPSAGPGSLHDFAGTQVSPQWEYTMSDNAATHTGRVDNLSIWIEKQQDLTAGISFCVQPGFCHEEFFQVPNRATAAIITATSSNNVPLLSTMEVCELGLNGICSSNVVIGLANSIILDFNSIPPLVPGNVYVVRVCNPNSSVECLNLKVAFEFASAAFPTDTFATNANLILPDDAVIYSSIFVSNHIAVNNLDVGMLINHARVSDLAITLISPSGTRITLFENRGGYTASGLGGSIGLVTNSFGVTGLAYTNLVPFYTNDFESSLVSLYAPGAIFQGWNVLTNFVDVIRDYTVPWQSNRVLVLGDGIVSNTLPVTNSTQYHLSFTITHAPYLVGTVGWWPFDGIYTHSVTNNGTNISTVVVRPDVDTPDIHGGHDALLSGDPTNGPGKIATGYYSDGVATKAVVPREWELDVGIQNGGFSIEGWINPGLFGASVITNMPKAMSDGFENAPEDNHLYGPGEYVSGWFVESGNVVILYPGYGFFGLPDSGRHSLDLNGTVAGSVSTNFSTVSGSRYVLNFAYTKDPSPAAPGYPNHVSSAVLDITGQPTIPFSYGASNDYSHLNWAHTSIVFTATSPNTKLQFTGTTVGDYGIELDSVDVFQLTNSPQPLVEWADQTNQFPQGVQFWISGLPGSNSVPGSLWANIWDTNLGPHILSIPAGSITNNGWQHVALTFDATNLVARIYTNGQLAIAQVMATTNMVPRTFGDLYFGFHPPGLQNDSCYAGGLDEFGLYNRPLSDCEILAIFNAGTQGKYGTNVLTCPVGLEVSMPGITGSPFMFTNIVSWTNPVPWFTNIDYTFVPVQQYTNGPYTNQIPFVLRALDPNTVVDNFVLSGWQTNFVSGLFHFNEDGTLALGEIKFGTTPYAASNQSPFLVWSNDFEHVTQAVYKVGSVLPGIPNNPLLGSRDWVVTNRFNPNTNNITVISNSAYAVSGSNWAALALGAVQTELPTTPGKRYKLTYSLHGPCAVGWWNGDVEPLSRRAQDLIGGNHGAFIMGASNGFPGFVGDHALYFNGEVELPPPFDPDIGGDRDDPGTEIDLGDPQNLRLTNSMTIEGWIQPLPYTEYLGTEQLFFRGDSRQCFDPYYLALEPDYANLPNRYLHFHVEDATGRGCGADVYAPGIPANDWTHVAAVFEPSVSIPDPPYFTNRMLLYVRGNLVASNYTAHAPFRDLDGSYSPQIAMGGNGGYLNVFPYVGLMDEMTVYARNVTPPEIRAIARRGRAGKADTLVAPSLSLAKLRVYLDDTEMDTGYGNNSTWTFRDVTFTATRTNIVLTLESLEPGTLVDMITLTEVPEELTYFPEESSLAELNGEDAYGLWQLEIWDTRTGGSSASTTNELVTWQLQFQLSPVLQAEPVYLSHGVTYTNSLRAHDVQYFIVNVPQWATVATNVVQVTNGNVSVYFNQTNFPPPFTNPPILSGLGTLSFALLSNSVPPLVTNAPYWLAVTNLNPYAVPLAVTVYFDITPLTNCVPATNFVGPAGIPRYFQFDIPTNGASGSLPQEVTFWLTGANTNVTVVLSEHLPLPDLTYHDYVSANPGTNDEIVLVVTNSTPFPVQTNRWYVGVFNLNPTNVNFTVQACYTTNYPQIIDLTNGIPFIVTATNSPFAAPPGPPRWLFYRFAVTNFASAMLFELYNMSGDGDLVLQREVPPGMAPYFESSFRVGTTPEQIVVRRTSDFVELRDDWYLGVYNNETNNLTYTIRAVTTDTNGLLVSAQPLNLTLAALPSPRGFLLSWHGVEGENYLIQYAPSLPPTWTDLATVVATTPFPTYEVYTPGFYRITQVPVRFVLRPTLTIRVSTINCPGPSPCVRISWPTSFSGFLLQSAPSPAGPWTFVNQPVFVEGNEYAVYDTIGSAPKYYRLFQ